jgi:hypothetical protein
VAKSGQRLRHSPEKTQRKAVRGTNEMKRSSNCGVRRVPCLFPFTDGLHVLCQLGPFTEMRAALLTRCKFDEQRLLNKFCIIGRLLEALLRSMCGNTSKREPHEKSRSLRVRFQIGKSRWLDSFRLVQGTVRVGLPSARSVARDQRLTRPQMV